MLPLTEVPVPAYSAAKQACLCVSVCVCVTLKYIAYFLLGRMFVLSCHAVALDVIHVYTEIVSTRRVNDTVPCDVLCLYQFNSVCREYAVSPNPIRRSLRHFCDVGSKHCRRHCAGNCPPLSDFR